MALAAAERDCRRYRHWQSRWQSWASARGLAPERQGRVEREVSIVLPYHKPTPSKGQVHMGGKHSVNPFRFARSDRIHAVFSQADPMNRVTTNGLTECLPW